jgi:pimeloyl-ACP methyl ester carboxylesterase
VDDHLLGPRPPVLRGAAAVAEIHWEARGSGPPVLIVHQVLWSYPRVYADLIEDLSRDHRVVTYDPRGCGASTRTGPYDTETDARDLLGVAEAMGGGATAMTVGYGFNLAARVGAERPDLISTVASVQPAAAAMLPRSELRESDVMAASDSVMDLLLGMLESDPRTALRSILAATNPDMGEDEVRDRVARVSEYMDPQAARERAEAWLADDPSEHARALGDRLWILHAGPEQLFEGTLAARVAELFPEAHIEQLEGGPISQPGLYAERIRRLAGDAA